MGSMRHYSVSSIVNILALLFFLSGSVTWGQSYDLTGYWKSNQGATYQFRQVDDRLFWFVDFSPRVVNVFYGTIAGNTITGRWADLPGGDVAGQGTVALRIESNNRIVKISETGNYGGTILGACQPTNGGHCV